MRNEVMLPVSVKAIVGPPGRVVLLRNERDEWELPGGRLEEGDASLAAALRREVAEELGITVIVGDLVHAWRYEPVPERHVLLLAYACEIVGSWPFVLHHSEEHRAARSMPIDEAMKTEDLPLGYRTALRRSEGSTG